MDTIPEESRPRPSGIRFMGNVIMENKPIPDEIRRRIGQVMKGEMKSVQVRGLADKPVVVTSRFRMLVGGQTPIMHVSHLVYTDGDITSSSMSHMKNTKREVGYTISTVIEGADYIAVAKHVTDCMKGSVSADNGLVVYTHSPEVVDGFINSETRKGDNLDE